MLLQRDSQGLNRVTDRWLGDPGTDNTGLQISLAVRENDGAGPSDLVATIGVPRSTVARGLSRLRKREFIERGTAPSRNRLECSRRLGREARPVPPTCESSIAWRRPGSSCASPGLDSERRAVVMHLTARGRHAAAARVGGAPAARSHLPSGSATVHDVSQPVRLPFDPIARASELWRERWGEDSRSVSMATATSVMRVQQLLLGRFDAIAGRHDLTFARYEALVLLAFSREGRLSMSRIGERLMVHPTSATNIVQRLAAQGLVERVPTPPTAVGPWPSSPMPAARRWRPSPPTSRTSTSAFRCSTTSSTPPCSRCCAVRVGALDFDL